MLIWDLPWLDNAKGRKYMPEDMDGLSQGSDVSLENNDESINNDEGTQLEASEEVAEQSVESEAAKPAEKMIPQSQVSKIAAREARLAAEKARQEVLAQRQREESESGNDIDSTQLGGMNQLSIEQVREEIQKQATYMTRLSLAQRIESEFKSKIDAEIANDPDFADLYDALNIEAHPELLIWANGLDNTAAVIKELAQHPTKFSNILMLAKSGSPKLAEKELGKISQSITKNLAAQSQKKAPPPLGNLKPSVIGTDDGEASVSDFRNMDWMRR